MNIMYRYQMWKEIEDGERERVREIIEGDRLKEREGDE